MNMFDRKSDRFGTAFYPLTVSAAIGLFWVMDNAEIGLVYSTYLPTVLAASIITTLEARSPAKENWSPGKEDIKTDLIYMIGIQWLLPALIAPVFILLMKILHDLIPRAAGIWPAQWPVSSQALLVLMIADFLSYWLHRAFHHFPLLWRLHQIHHSPEKLYWLNVARFHPLEKILQLSVTSLPFILLGVQEKVLALYLVFYAVNGFFQHCNIRLRYGLLNYLVSSAELHRWHHSRSLKISCSNFGNNLILWDLLFGTWYWPKNRLPQKMGLKNRSFPRQFVEQLKEPFKQDRNLHIPGIVSTFSGKTRLSLLMWLIQIIYLKPFLKAAGAPRKTQGKVLSKVLKANRGTEFGIIHGFSKIKSYEDYVRKVPIQNHESLHPLIEKQISTGSNALAAGKPMLYALTSGTTGHPKYIPVYSRTLKQYRQEQSLYALRQYRSRTEGMNGKTLAIASPAIEGHCRDGTPFGSASGLVYQSMPKVFQEKYVIPPEIFAIQDYDLKYRVILCLALAERNITCLVSANPSSLLRLVEIFRESGSDLIEAVAKGQLKRSSELPPKIQQAANRRLLPNPSRAEELQSLVSSNKTALRDLWPLIDTVNTWTGGSCGIALDALKRQLPSFTQIRELGYISTELRVTLPILANSRSGLPVLHHHFFEFIERGDWEEGKMKTILLDQLEVGQEYYIIVTTNSGLYRYFMNDIIRVDGFYKKTPLIRFIRKGLDVTSITGEKLYQNHVIDSIKSLQKRIDHPIPFFLMLADRYENRYRLFIEMMGKEYRPGKPLSDLVDHLLGTCNLEYRQKRMSRRLKPIKVMRLREGAGEAFKTFYLKRGQREGQFKPRLLQYLDECAFPILDYITDRHHSWDQEDFTDFKPKSVQIGRSNEQLQNKFRMF